MQSRTKSYRSALRKLWGKPTEKQKNVTRYDVTGDHIRPRSFLQKEHKEVFYFHLWGMYVPRHLKTSASFYQILLDLDPNLVRSPLGTFDALLQGWRGVLQPLLHQVLRHNFNRGFANAGWKFEITGHRWFAWPCTCSSASSCSSIFLSISLACFCTSGS